MKSPALPVPGLILGAYPERRASGAEAHFRAAPTRWQDVAPLSAEHYRRFVERVRASEASDKRPSPASLAQRLAALRARFSREGLADAPVAEAFAVIGSVCEQELGKIPHDCQLVAARAILDNHLVEMATGEGKTLAAALAASAAALAGVPVHVITANDYLAERDARALAPLYRALHLTVGTVLQSTPQDNRRAAYDCDIAYCTAKELAFDYLRDGLSGARTRNDLLRRAGSFGPASPDRQALLRGLCMAIVDEADSVLIDEARVPLVISARLDAPQQSRFHEQALALARRLSPAVDFDVDRKNMRATLTAPGRIALEAHAASAGSAWRNRAHREETVCLALAALHLYERDRHYLVRDGGVVIIDENTGRPAPGRAWSRGLHQLVEMNEGCMPGAETRTAAQITYQRFFRRYLKLGGMSGTLREARPELHSVYGLRVVAIPTHRPCRREIWPTRLFADRDSQMDAVVREVARVSATGRPVLIGTTSIIESRALASRLRSAGISPRVLDASQDRNEAAIVAAAGERGQITVATNMAGRGTDIALGDGVARLGGLHVICCHHNASARIDRQLVGRCARQGDPGSAQFLLACDARPVVSRLAALAGAPGWHRPGWLVALLVTMPQWFEERRQRTQRRTLLQRDLQAETTLTFGNADE